MNDQQPSMELEEHELNEDGREVVAKSRPNSVIPLSFQFSDALLLFPFEIVKPGRDLENRLSGARVNAIHLVEHRAASLQIIWTRVD